MSDRKSSVVFMGSPEFAVPTLDALIDASDIDVVRVVSQPDRPKGRGKKVAPTPVRARALEHGVTTLQMSKKNYADVVAELTPLAPDLIVVAAFGLILRRDLLGLPTKGCINLHPSLLPRHRGVSPIQTTILSGDRETGCTTMMMDDGVDTGDILLVEKIDAGDRDTAGALEAKLARMGAPLIVKTVRGLVDGSVTAREQDHALATHTRKIRKKDGQIDWTQPARDTILRVRAMSPWPTAFTAFQGRRLIVLEARVGGDGPAGVPGEIVSLDPLAVSTGDGLVELVRVKPEGKNEMPIEAFKAGYQVRAGDVLE